MSEITKSYQDFYDQNKSGLEELKKRLLAGQPLSQDEIKVVALSFMQGTVGDRSVSTVMSSLDRMERDRPGSTQLAELQTQVKELSKLSPDEQKRAFITAGTIVLAGAASFGIPAVVSAEAARAEAAGFAGNVIKAAVPKAAGLTGLKALTASHPFLTMLAKLGITGGVISGIGKGLGAFEPPSENASENPSQTQNAGDNLIVIDPQTGESQIVPRSTIQGGLPVPGGAGDMDPALAALASQYGLDLSGPFGGPTAAKFNREIYGDVTVTPGSFPQGISVGTGKAATGATPATLPRVTGRVERDPTTGEPVPEGIGFQTGGQVRNIVPPGDRKSTRLNSSHIPLSRMPSSA